jgi:hypothetical protein
MKILFLLVMVVLSFGRDNPFVPIVVNQNSNLIKQKYFTQKTISLPSDARVLKSVSLKYQTLTGAIKEIQFPINQAVDWHNPIIIKSKQKQVVSKKIKVGFLNFYIKKQIILIETTDKIERKFLLVEPFRYVIDFKADKNFLTYSKVIDSFVKKVVVGNHQGFYRVVLYLDGKYKTEIKKDKKGYLIEFK